MTDSLDLDLELVGRYVTGAASPDERRALERWMAADPARRELVAQLESVWQRTGTLDTGLGADAEVDVDAKWQALRQAMHPTRVVRFPLSPPPRPRYRTWISAAAAVIAIAAGIGVLWQAGAWRPAPEVVAPVAMREYVTPRGQRAEFRLPDGTRVMLSVESRLRVPADYGTRDRELYLDGEAYFEVEHDPTARFLVHTGDVTTEDLGTRFAVRAYPADSAVRVVVAEGRVALRADQNEALLNAGQLGRATATGEVVKQTGGDIAQYLAWTEGRLEFASTPLGDALPELSRWFDLDFRLGDRALADRRVTASFRDQPDDQMLAGLALTLGLRVERRGRIVTFYDASDAGQ